MDFVSLIQGYLNESKVSEELTHKSVYASGLSVLKSMIDDFSGSLNQKGIQIQGINYQRSLFHEECDELGRALMLLDEFEDYSKIFYSGVSENHIDFINEANAFGNKFGRNMSADGINRFKLDRKTLTPFMIELKKIDESSFNNLLSCYEHLSIAARFNYCRDEIREYFDSLGIKDYYHEEIHAYRKFKEAFAAAKERVLGNQDEEIADILIVSEQLKNIYGRNEIDGKIISLAQGGQQTKKKSVNAQDIYKYCLANKEYLFKHFRYGKNTQNNLSADELETAQSTIAGVINMVYMYDDLSSVREYYDKKIARLEKRVDEMTKGVYHDYSKKQPAQADTAPGDYVGDYQI